MTGHDGVQPYHRGVTYRAAVPVSRDRERAASGAGPRSGVSASLAHTPTAEDLRRFQLHLTETRIRPPTINGTVSALRFFFTVTLGRADVARSLTFVAEPRKIPVILSPEEVARFLEAAPGPKYKAALGAAYGAGLRVSEVASRQLRIMLSPFQHRASICNTFYRDE
jgi:site-specific recombinase XerD